MASASKKSITVTAATLPQLLAINKNFSDLDEQIRQITHIIGLPNDWYSIYGERDRLELIPRPPYARAEWVLRWTLDKLKDDKDSGAGARVNPQLWTLLDWIVLVLPVPRSAALLRDAGFLSILEKTLHENFDADITTPSDSSGEISPTSESVLAPDAVMPSRKRKRSGSASTSSSPKKKVSGTTELANLFDALIRLLKSMGIKAEKGIKADFSVDRVDSSSAEHMKMALTTESAQAARILKHWLAAVQRFLRASLRPQHLPESRLDLSVILKIWELRVIEAGDKFGASAEQFSTECLIPTLILHSTLHEVALGDESDLKDKLGNSIQCVEKLLARHIFLPSRAALFTRTSPSKSKPEITSHDKTMLSINLEPLRAKLLQAAQILDNSWTLPNSFISLFESVPRLLDVAIRYSPSRTPKARITELPWLQAVFTALAECIGCPLEAPSLSIPQPSVDALRQLLEVLHARDLRIDSEIVVKMFWFHTGVKYPQNESKLVQWALIAALIDLDAAAFIRTTRSAPVPSEDDNHDPVALLFEEVSSFDTTLSTVDAMDVVGSDGSINLVREESIGRKQILQTIVVPMMIAFSRNRDFLGFLSRWDDRLVKCASITRNPLRELETLVWEDFNLNIALEGLLEDSLTPMQIQALFQEHAKRVEPVNIDRNTSPKDLTPEQTFSLRKSYSSVCIIRGILGSVDNDAVQEALQPSLLDVLASLATAVRDPWYRANVTLNHYWITIAQIINIIWPLSLHGSLEMQQTLLLPLLSQATKDVSHARKSDDDTHVNSETRTAILTFLLAVCNLLRKVDWWQDEVKESLRKSLRVISTNQLEPEDLQKLLEFFVTDYVQLLDCTEVKYRQKILREILKGISSLEDVRSQFAEVLGETIFSSCGPETRSAFAATLLDAFDRSEDSPSLDDVAVTAFLQVRAENLGREQREVILNKLVELVAERSKNVAPLLRIMLHLMQMPNATAELSSDSNTLFHIADQLAISKTESPAVIHLFQDLVCTTIGHILQNKDQNQNERFLSKYKRKLNQPPKWSSNHSPARIALFSGTLLAQKQEGLFTWESFLDLLGDGLEDAFTAEEHMLEALVDIPSSILRSKPQLFEKIQKSLNALLALKVGTDLTVSAFFRVLFSNAESVAQKVLLVALIAKFRLFPNDAIKDFVTLSSDILNEKITAAEISTVLESVHDLVSGLKPSERLVLANSMIGSDDSGLSFACLPTVASTLVDKPEEDEAQRTRQLSILPRVCDLLSERSDMASLTSLLDTINIIIGEKPFLTSQHSIEETMSLLDRIASRASPAFPSSEASNIYSRLCETSRLLLLVHRGRLGGRFHILLSLLQNLLSCLFVPYVGRGDALPSWLRSTSSTAHVSLTSSNASRFSRILSALCSPTQSSVTTTKKLRTDSSKLNDPVKAAKEYASHYVYTLLASFCRSSLSGRLEPTVRDKLLPGIWDVVNVANMDRDALNAMFAGLDEASREVWRGVWEEWGSANGKTMVAKDRE